jgi:hypothetical protein
MWRVDICWGITTAGAVVGQTPSLVLIPVSRGGKYDKYDEVIFSPLSLWEKRGSK